MANTKNFSNPKIIQPFSGDCFFEFELKSNHQEMIQAWHCTELYAKAGFKQICTNFLRLNWTLEISFDCGLPC